MKDGLIIDMFAGGGGASVGIEMALGRPVDIAVNHDPEAIRMHKVNHPDTLHLTEDVFTVNLAKHVRGRRVALLWASPDCTSHSKAKGGQPRNSGLRILPWAVHKHAKAIKPEVIIMENVEEIQEWGPLDETGRPIKERAGEDYQKFIKAMKALGYKFDCRELVAADYGAPTTRKRWYAIFRKDGDIKWPKPTHDKAHWLQCGDYIDWSDLGKSIFDRSTPLAEATQRRIANGVRKFIIDNPHPYIVKDERAAAFLIQYHSEQKAGDARGQMLTEPLKTIDTSNRYGLVSAFLTKFYKTGTGQPLEEPLHTITTSPGHFGCVSAYVMKYFGQGTGEACTDPLHTITAGGLRFAAISAWLTKYYGTGGGQECDEPLATITTKDRFGVVNVLLDIHGEKYIIADIFLRMLNPEELKLCQGFPEDYIIDHDIEGKPYPKKEQVARIGNSVVPIMAQKLVEANCGYLKVGERMPNLRVKQMDDGQMAFAV